MAKEKYLNFIARIENKKLKEMLSETYIQVINELVIGRDKPIYRLNAHFNNFEGDKLKDLSNYGKKHAKRQLVQNLKKVSNPPDRIYSNEQRTETNHVSADWYPIYPINFNRIEDYLALLENFMNYINSFHFTKGHINLGMFSDSPAKYTEEEKFYNEIFGIEATCEKRDLKKSKLNNLKLEKDVNVM